MRTLFLLAIYPLAPCLAQLPGTFIVTGSMSVPRVAHTATLLYDGKVLIAGGYSIFSGNVTPFTSAEIYDPLTATFTPTVNMTATRAYHTATLLPDGRVLIAGGYYFLADQGFTVASSAEIYDPVRGAFIGTGGMSTPRMGHSATLLNDGRVLIAGGVFNGRVIASAEIYDPLTGMFTPTGDMTIGRTGHIATLLPDGKVFIAPGDDGPDYRTADIFDPVSGAFHAVNWHSSGSTAGSASLLPNGKVLFTLQPPEGDFDSKLATVYDVSTAVFADTPPMEVASYWPSSTILSNGSVLLTGSNVGCEEGSQGVEFYDAAAAAFFSLANMLAARSGHTATLLEDGTVLVAGGNGTSGCPPLALASAERFTPPSIAPPPVLLSSSGANQGAILHAGTSRIVSAADPAVTGEILEIYLTGLLDHSVIPPRVAVGGRLAEVVYFGNAPGFAGLNQIDIRVPGGVAPGPAIPVRLMYLGRHSTRSRSECSNARRRPRHSSWTGR